MYLAVSEWYQFYIYIFIQMCCSLAIHCVSSSICFLRTLKFKIQTSWNFSSLIFDIFSHNLDLPLSRYVYYIVLFGNSIACTVWMCGVNFVCSFYSFTFWITWICWIKKGVLNAKNSCVSKSSFFDSEKILNFFQQFYGLLFLWM